MSRQLPKLHKSQTLPDNFSDLPLGDSKVITMAQTSVPEIRVFDNALILRKVFNAPMEISC